jgi:hypothetical protein
MESTQKRQLLWLALSATIVWTGLMGWEVAGFHREQCQNLPADRGFSSQLASPIAELTITRSVSTFQLLIDQCEPEVNRLWNANVAQTNTCMDFLFIGLYGSVFLLFASVLQGKLSNWLRISILLTMLMDVGENVRLLLSLHALLNPPSGVHPPGVFSLLKWVLFAVSLFLLSALFGGAHQVGRWWRYSMATILSLAGTTVIAGLFYLPLLTLAIGLLGIALLIGLGLYFPIHPFSVTKLLLWIETLYLLRFQIFGGLVVSVVLPISYFAAPSIFIGVFDALGFISFIFVVWAELQLAWTVMITSQMIFVYGPDRYAALRGLTSSKDPLGNRTASTDRLSWRAVGLFGALALPSIIMTINGTLSVHWWAKIIGVVVATALSLTVLWLTARVQIWLEPDPSHTAKRLFPDFILLKPREDVERSRVGKALDRTVDRILPMNLKGGIVSSAGRLRSGHQLAATAVVVLLVIYVIAGFSFSPSSGLKPPAAIFFLLFLLNLLTWGFSGLAFFLDVLRIPVLTLTLALSMVFGSIATDHTFKGDSLDQADVAPSPQQVLTAWNSTRGKDPSAPIIVVATAGGGIRASAWTAEVLTRVVHDCQRTDGTNEFVSSLLLVSSVSGGSEGTMYVLGSYKADGTLDAGGKKLQDIRDASSMTALSAVGWGILYPDFLRTIPGVGSLIGAIFGHNIDRGWALENQWIKNWKNPVWSDAPKMKDWIDDTRRGMRPAVIFNSTVSETGQRFVIASTNLPASKEDSDLGTTSLQFGNAYPKLNIPISTAARLSASFPWVSPMPRTEKDFFHFADGGYYDNSGVLSAGEWLLAIQDQIKDRKVVLILIDATSADRLRLRPWSWQRQFVAPIGTLLSVRTSSQHSRAAFELSLMSDLLKSKGVTVMSYPLSYPPDRLAPLSWHLTPEQQRSIGTAWSNPSSKLYAERQKLYQVLACQVEEPHSR